MEHAGPQEHLAALPWLVLTPSADRDGWGNAILKAATDLGWLAVTEFGAADYMDGRQLLVVTDDAARAHLAGATQIAAIVAEPESAPEAVDEIHSLHAPHSNWHASMLLSRALALAPAHQVVTPDHLARKPESIVLFNALRIVPPASKAEVSRRPAVAAAFRMYRNLPKDVVGEIEWSEKLFAYDPRAARDWVDWGVLDTTGRPRILVQGSSLWVPQGCWRARVRFAVDADAAKRQYRLDWGTRADCASTYISPGEPGVYEIEQDFVWDGADVAEIRLILTEGSFTGTLIFQGMTIRYVPEAERTAN